MNQPLSNSPLIASNLSKVFGKKRALNSLNFSLPATGITALLGANGAGKTTLINCALGLCKPSRGELSVLGGNAGAHRVKQQVGVMLQDADLPDLLSAREHIALFSTYYPNPIPVDELITRCDLCDFADKRYKHLSGGQKRRVQFALAILGRPKLVFLDEPTTGLDIDARRVLWNTIRALGEAGTAVVLTTHYLEEADSLADHTIVISAGAIVANAPTTEIREAVSGAVIRCETKLNIETAGGLARVRSTQQSGRYLEILSHDGTATVKDLLNADPDVRDLSIQKPSLEDAFTRLTQADSNLGEHV